MSGLHHTWKYLSLTVISILLLTALISLRENLPQSQTLFGHASFKPADIYLDTSRTLGPLPKPWQSLSQGGESPDFQLSPILDQVGALHPQTIRLDHIFDYYVTVQKTAQGDLAFDWSKLDALLQSITAIGATPFLSLSYMPQALSRSDTVDRPVNWADWQDLVKATVEHISGRSHLNFSGVYYEVWNEPDLFGHWKLYGDKNYLNLYEASVIGAQSAVDINPFFIGGPATAALYDNWINDFYQYAQDHNLRVDFYSWHRYSLTPQDYVDDVIHYANLVRFYPQFIKAEPIISEFGPNSSHDPGYDNYLSAAHTSMVLSQLVPTLKHTFIFEIQDGKDPEGSEFWGSWGLLTHPDFGSHEKPRYQALKFMNLLGPDRLSLIGQGTYVGGLAAKTETGAIQVLLTNYDPKDTHTETVPVHFQNLNLATYRLTTEFLGRLPTSTLVPVSAPNLIHTLDLPPNSLVLLTLEAQ